MIFLANFLRNPLPKEGLFPVEAIKLPRLTPHISYMMKVGHHQTLCAWMQSQNLCLTDSLILGRQKTFCLEMKAGGDASPPFVDRNSFVPKGPHKSKFLAGVDRVPNLRPVKLVNPHKIPLPFLHHSSHACGIIDNRVPSKLSGVIKETIHFNLTTTI